MDNRVWASGAAASPPTAPASPSVGYPSPGDPLTATPASKGGAFWFHQIGEELRAVLTAAGITPSTANNAQLLEAIQRLIDAQSGNYALDTGAANAYVVAISPAIAAYGDGMTVRVKAVNANTGASTLNAGGGAVALVNDVGGALVAGDIPASGIFTATYIASAGKFHITSLVKSQTVGTVIISESATNIAGSTSFDTYTDTANSLSLTPGRWIIQWGGRINIISSGGSGFCLPELTLTDAANTIIKKAKGISVLAGQSAYASPVDSCAVVDVAIDTTYKLRFCAASYSGTPILASVDTNGGATKTTLMGTKL